MTGNVYYALAALLRYQRIINNINGHVPDKINIFIQNAIQKIIDNRSDRNSIIDSYNESKEAKQYRKEFGRYGLDNQIRLKYPKLNDQPERQGDLLLLKPNLPNGEKGVIFVQYNDAINKFCAIYDIQKMAMDYRIVIEPSTWGYQDPIFYFLFGIKTDVIVEAQYEKDYNYIKGLHSNLYPLRIGAGDWVDPDIFKPYKDCQKKYDIIMIASWLSLKRHDLFFKSLEKIKKNIRKVAVVGYPMADRTLKDIIKEAKRYNVINIVDLFEKITQESVSELLK